MPKLLKFVEKNHLILRKTMPEVVDFKDPSLQELIENMCFSILPEQLKAANGAHEGAAGMAANQWGIEKRVFVFTPDGSHAGSRREVMINPSYVPFLRIGEAQPEMVPGYEGCFSVPLTTGVVNRFQKILASYFTPEGEKVERMMEGWEARVFQHETDHLDGKLFDGRLDNFAGPECLERVVFKDRGEMDEFWESKVRESRKE